MKAAADPRPVLVGAIVALLAALVAASAAVLAMPPEQLAPRLWRGYYTILAAPSDRLESFAAALEARPGIEVVVSQHTSVVSFNTFEGFTSLPVADLAARLDPQDPRYDSYLRGLSAYFRGTEGTEVREVMYIRTDRSAAWLLMTLARLPEARGLDLRILEAGHSAVLRLGLFCAFAVLLVAWQQRLSLRLLSAAASVPWLAVVCFGSGASLAAALTLLPLWAALLASVYPFLRERLLAPVRRGEIGGRSAVVSARRGLSRVPIRLAAIFLAVVAVFLLLQRAGQPLGVVALAAACGLLLLPLLYAVLALELAWRQHVPFWPEPILRAWKGAARGRGASLTAGALIICLAVISLPALHLGSRMGRAVVPEPARPVSEAAGLSWAALEALSRDTQGRMLPDLADYLTHRAYQEGLAFGRSYVFPSLGERVVIPSFAHAPSGESVVRADRVVLRYPDAWLERTLHNAPEGSVARLLADQRQALPVSVSDARPPAPIAPMAALYLCVVLLLGLVLLPEGFDLTARALCANRGLALRGRQQSI